MTNAFSGWKAPIAGTAPKPNHASRICRVSSSAEHAVLPEAPLPMPAIDPDDEQDDHRASQTR